MQTGTQSLHKVHHSPIWALFGQSSTTSAKSSHKNEMQSNTYRCSLLLSRSATRCCNKSSTKWPNKTPSSKRPTKSWRPSLRKNRTWLPRPTLSTKISRTNSRHARSRTRRNLKDAFRRSRSWKRLFQLSLILQTHPRKVNAKQREINRAPSSGLWRTSSSEKAQSAVIRRALWLYLWSRQTRRLLSRPHRPLLSKPMTQNTNRLSESRTRRSMSKQFLH